MSPSEYFYIPIIKETSHKLLRSVEKVEVPQEKPNSYQSLLQVEYFQTTDFSTETKEKVLVYFAKDTLARDIKPGEKVIFGNSPQTIKNNGNPFEFDYKKYMERRKIYRQVYLPSDKWTKASLPTSKSVIVKAELVRKKLLEIYENNNTFYTAE